MKKFFLVGILANLMFISNVFAACSNNTGDSNVATVTSGGTTKYCDSFDAALEEANKSESKITLKSNVELKTVTRISVNNKVTIDLNNNNIDSKQDITLIIDKGEVEITGKGEILNSKEVEYPDPKYQGKKYGTNFGTVYVKGAKDSASDYTHLTIGKDVTVKGSNPLVIDAFSGADNDCYGVTVDVYGKLINNKESVLGNYVIGVNTAIKHKENAPIINIHGGAKLFKEETVTSPIVGISLMGYANLNIDKAEISADTGLLIYSGVVKLNNTTISASGTEGNIEGNVYTVSRGSAIQIESNSGYAGDIELTIDGGKYTSKNNAAILEYLKSGKTVETTETTVKSIKIKNGEFTTAARKNPITASEEFTKKHTNFITGGTFKGGESIDASYLAKGYELKEDGTVAVIPSSNPTPSNPSKPEVSEPEVDEKKETEITENVTYVDNGEGLEIEGSIVTETTETTEAIKETYDKMIDVLKERGYTEIFNMYEFHVKDNKALTKLLTITFDLGEKNNGRIAYILHQKHDGSYEEFENTVENGKVSITVSELSPFVVALKDKEEETVEESTGNNAQTSSINVVTCGILTGISLIGIVVLGIKMRKFKEAR